MLQPVLDLYGGTSWNYIYRRTIEARDGQYPNTFNPISDVIVDCPSNIALIACLSPIAIPLTWRVGCWASLNLGITPDSTSTINFFTQILREAIPFGSFKLLVAPRYEGPFFLRLEIPYWLESIYIEALAYDGIQTTQESQQIAEILARLG